MENKIRSSILNSQNNGGGADLTTGSLVTGFGINGVITDNPSTGYDYPSAIAIDATGIYVTGGDYSLGDSQWRTEKRHLTDGGQ